MTGGYHGWLTDGVLHAQYIWVSTSRASRAECRIATCGNYCRSLDDGLLHELCIAPQKRRVVLLLFVMRSPTVDIFNATRINEQGNLGSIK